MKHRYRLALIAASMYGALIVLSGQEPSPSRPVSAASLSPEAVARATTVLAQAHDAMGGEKLRAVKTVVATGRTRRVRGDNIQPIEFEISIELPDKYLRKDEFPAEESDPTSTGFNADAVIQLPVAPARPAPPRVGATPPPATSSPAGAGAARLVAAKQDFVRFALGLFASSFETYPLTFAYAARATAPQGAADVLDVHGSDGFAARLFVDVATRLPIMISWQLPPTNVIVTVPGQAAPSTIAPGAVVIPGPPLPATSASQEEKDAFSRAAVALRAKAMATPVEHRIYFRDYQDVDGVKFPFGLRRAIGADTTEETTFDRYRVNTRIDPRRFDVGK